MVTDNSGDATILRKRLYHTVCNTASNGPVDLWVNFPSFKFVSCILVRVTRFDPILLDVFLPSRRQDNFLLQGGCPF